MISREPVPPTALILRALGLGDLLTAVPALRALRRRLPGHELVLLTLRRFGPLALATGLADRVIDTVGWHPLPASLTGADVAVNLHGRGPQSHRLLLATRPDRLVAFACGDIADGPEWSPGEHEVARWCRLVAHAGFPVDPDDLTMTAPPRPVPAAAVDAVVLHPGAASKARRWPVERWAEVARAQTAAGRRVVITGAPDERVLGEELARRASLPATAMLSGCTDVLDLMAIVDSARCVACGDTGVAHVATAVGTPSVVLFGPTPPSEWGPPARPRHRVLWKGQRGDPHGRLPHPGLLAISADDVIDALDQLEERSISGAASR